MALWTGIENARYRLKYKNETSEFFGWNKRQKSKRHEKFCRRSTFVPDDVCECKQHIRAF